MRLTPRVNLIKPFLEHIGSHMGKLGCLIIVQAFTKKTE
jgi:hypothetical protein